MSHGNLLLTGGIVAISVVDLVVGSGELFHLSFFSLLRFVSLLSDTQNECPSYLVPRKLGVCNLKCRMEREVCGKMICYSFWNLISVVPSIVRLYVLVGRSIFFRHNRTSP